MTARVENPEKYFKQKLLSYFDALDKLIKGKKFQIYRMYLLSGITITNRAKGQSALSYGSQEVAMQVMSAFSAAPSLQLDKDIVSKVVAYAIDKRLGADQEGFIAQLGHKKFDQYAPLIAPHLNNPELAKTTIWALNRMKVSGYADKVRPYIVSSNESLSDSAQYYIATYS